VDIDGAGLTCPSIALAALIKKKPDQQVTPAIDIQILTARSVPETGRTVLGLPRADVREPGPRNVITGRFLCLVAVAHATEPSLEETTPKENQRNFNSETSRLTSLPKVSKNDGPANYCRGIMFSARSVPRTINGSSVSGVD
jgi:hypothetical protein